MMVFDFVQEVKDLDCKLGTRSEYLTLNRVDLRRVLRLVSFGQIC